ncbi:hypothetical protein J31TS4_28780 [Paenibacillus sp. J31TS4]|uniref:AAA family ATPase n=1 Tax=Paenibacillus sp. J31TS4 TaxID=2807195 RepID=UPI001B188358|nr:SMC family ATPase [Paenibacillus sp. J31TS4]GIP39598.1 hypothetical protein J31TS4_28780 [Paenibacillus sp. J31TS4]
MKPVYLSLAGLQSYREKQEIDFTQLCGTGVFGIFGPTGSGKSTVLDAMTLALYGKVERASNGTQGILNHAEQALSVAFQFELSHASGCKVYRVERQFKRGHDLSVNNTVSRLIDLSRGESVVLADKVAEVNQGVQQLLGLSMQDFTRAVVLPQGKFAEFLALKGSERRQMLQRLFHLEQYGDVLNGRLSQQVKETDSLLKETRAEQLGLGDASEEALAIARERLTESAEAADKARKTRTETEEGVRRRRELHELQQEAAGLEEALAALTGREEEMAERERKLALADRADRLYPLLQDLREASRRSEELGVRLAETERRHEQAEAERREAAEAHANAKRALADEEPAVRRELEQLRHALRLEEEIRTGEAGLGELIRQLGEAGARAGSLVEQETKEKERYDRALQLQAELKEQLKKAEVKNEDRLLLQEAGTAHQRMLAVEKQQQELEGEAGEAARSAQAAEAEASEAEALRTRLAGELAEAAARAAEDAGLLESLAAEHERLQQALTAGIAAEQAAQRERERGQLAALLAADLAPGCPCPVCGSAQHPQPAAAAGHAAPPPEEALARLERLHADAREQHGRTGREQGAAQLLLERLQAALAPAGPAAAGLAEAAAASAPPAAPAPAPASAAPQPAAAGEAAWRAALAALGEQLGAAASRLAALGERTRPLAAQLVQAERRLGDAAARLAAQRGVEAGLARKLAAARAEAERLTAEWRSRFPALPPERLAAELERLHASDRAAEELRGRLEKSVPFLEQTLEKLEGLRRALADAEKESVRLEADRAGREQLLGFKKQELAGIVGEEQAARKLQQAEERLAGLTARERGAGERLERLQNALQELSRMYIAVKQEYGTWNEQRTKTETVWNEALARSVFDDPGQVETARLDEEQAAAWTEDVRQYREETAKLRSRLERVAERLGPERLTDEEWETWLAKLAEAVREDEEALQRRAKAERDLDELEKKHAHWRSLEEKRLAAERKAGRLGKLQTVLRGNAFVEFMAEEQLMQVSREASRRLGQLTRQRYALEVDSAGGFVIRDDANGGIRRPVASLSGGETFLTSLALALALSAQIQLNGQYPLEFFFLDEGFGTLDPELLDTVIGSLEKLHSDALTVGIISHVPELKARLPRRLVVHPADAAGRGSRIELETF